MTRPCITCGVAEAAIDSLCDGCRLEWVTRSRAAQGLPMGLTLDQVARVDQIVNRRPLPTGVAA